MGAPKIHSTLRFEILSIHYTDPAMSFALLRYQVKPRSLQQINLLSRACYHGLQKGQYDFFVHPAYPDTTEPPIFVLDKKARVMKWDETNATLSEASVKADQEFNNQPRKVRVTEKITEFEKNKEPELDEM